MNNIIEKIKNIYCSLKEKFLQFYEENQKLTYIISALLLVILICIILLITTAENTGKKNKQNQEQKLEISEKLEIPDGPALPKDYTSSRKTKEKWSTEEAEPWFTIPNEKEVESLGKANDSLVNEIIGAAP